MKNLVLFLLVFFCFLPKIGTSQFKRIVYIDDKDRHDVNPDMVTILDYINYKFDALYNKPLYVLKIEDGKVYVDTSKYTDEEIEYVKNQADLLMKSTGYSKDKLIDNEVFAFDSGVDSDYDWGNDSDKDWGNEDGPFKKYNGDVVIQEGQYKNGLMTGEWIFRYDSGSLKGKGNYINSDGGNVGSTGIPRNGRDGEWILYHENGNKSQVGSYVNGKQEGEFMLYHENGNKKSVYSYSNGTRDFEGNRQTDYNEDGSVKNIWVFSYGEWEKYLSPEEKEKQRKEAIENPIKEFNSPTQVLDFLTGYVFINYDDNIAVIFTGGDYEHTRFIVVYDPEEGDVFGDVKYPGSFTDLNSLKKAKKMNWGTIYREDIETRGSYARIDFGDQILYVNVNGKLEGLDNETYGHGKVLMRMDYSW